MTSMTKHTLVDCFSLRARIGWQGLRSDEFKTEGPYLVTGVDFHNGRVDWDDCYHVSVDRYEQDKGIQLRENDLLVTKDGTVGKTAFVVDCPEQATLNSHIFLVRSKDGSVEPEYLYYIVPFPVSWTVKMKKKQKETQDILSYHTQAAGCSDKARAKASGGRQPIEECGRTGL